MGTAVGLIKGGLEDIGDPEIIRELLHSACGIEYQLFALDNTGTRNEKEWPIKADLITTQFHPSAPWTSLSDDLTPPG